MSTRVRLIVAAGVLVLVAAVGAVVVYLRLVPDYRTTLLVDASATSATADPAGFTAIADAVGAAALNAADDDALALRRFGGACDSGPKTTQLVAPGRGHGRRISDAVRAIEPAGQATLLSGVDAAIDDFRGRYPPRGSTGNRIIVVTTAGIDGCTGDQAAVTQAVQRLVREAGLRIDFRFVGYRVDDRSRQDGLAEVANATGAPEPTFVQTSAELTTHLAQVIVPDSPDAAPVTVPKPTPSADWLAVARAHGRCAIGPDEGWGVQDVTILDNRAHDLTGDGVPDIALEQSCTGGNHPPGFTVVYDGESVNQGRPRAIGEFPREETADFGPDVPLPEGTLVHTAQARDFDGAGMTVRGIGYLDFPQANVPFCCPNLAYEVRMTWSGERFEPSNLAVWACEPPGDVQMLGEDEARRACPKLR